MAQQPVLEDDPLEKLAMAHHRLFCKQMETEGYRWGPTTDKERKTHSSLVDWADLPADEQEQNRSAVRDIPNKLAQIGYVMIPARSNQAPFEFPEEDEDLQRLAEMEHERWMAERIRDGWTCGARDEAKRTNPYLVPWEELPEDAKEFNRNIVRTLPACLAEVGLQVYRPGRQGDKETRRQGDKEAL